MLMKMVTKRKDATTNTIIMTIADHRWQDLVVNWMACLHRLRLSNYIIISADPQLHDALGRIGAPSFYRSVFFNPYSGSGGGGDGGAKGDRYRGAVWSYRWQLIGSVLKRGVHVVHIDIDALLVRNFAPMLQALVGAGSGGVFGSSSSSGGGGVATATAGGAGGGGPNQAASFAAAAPVRPGGGVPPHVVFSRGSKLAADMLGLGFAFLRSSPQTLAFLPKFQALAQRTLDDNRAANLILNTGK